MDYREIKFTRFISPTTCYSGMKRVGQGEDGVGVGVVGSLATETDLLRYSVWHNSSSSNNNNNGLSGYALPKPASDDVVCVGYDALGDHHVFILLDNDEVLDTMMTDDTTSQQSHHGVVSSGGGLTTTASTAASSSSSSTTTTTTPTDSVATSGVVAAIVAATPRQQLARANSHATISSNSGDVSVGDSTMMLPPTNKTATTTTTTSGGDDPSSHTSYLVYMMGETVIGGAATAATTTTTTTTSIPCRLVAPTMCKVGMKNYSSSSCSSHSKNNEQKGVDGDIMHLLWVGSADGPELRCFLLHGKSITPLDLSGFEAMTSPVMVIDIVRHDDNDNDKNNNHHHNHHHYDDDDDDHTNNSPSTTTYTLALGGQDGTVRLHSFSCCFHNDDSATTTTSTTTSSLLYFENIQTHQVIVDGPILSLHLSEQRLLVGSMCGYVCQLVRKRTTTNMTTTTTIDSDENDKNINNNNNNDTHHHHHHNNEWEEPTMIVQDFLWDARYKSDDPILAVYYWNHRIILGTYSGIVQVHVLVEQQQWSSSFSNNNNKPQQQQQQQQQEIEEEEKTMKRTTTNNKNNTSSTYQVEWSCRLPYPIHCITHCDENNVLLITTKHSLHVFEAFPLYSADRAKRRLQRLFKT